MDSITFNLNQLAVQLFPKSDSCLPSRKGVECSHLIIVITVSSWPKTHNDHMLANIEILVAHVISVSQKLPARRFRA